MIWLTITLHFFQAAPIFEAYVEHKFENFRSKQAHLLSYRFDSIEKIRLKCCVRFFLTHSVFYHESLCVTPKNIALHLELHTLMKKHQRSTLETMQLCSQLSPERKCTTR